MEIRRNHALLLIGLLVFLLAVTFLLRNPSDGARGLMLLGFRTPRIEPEHERVDLGIIPNREPTTLDMNINNTGRGPLTVQAVTSACRDCLTATIDRPTIPPDESATLTLRMDPMGIPTFDYSTSVSIASNDPERRMLVIAVECEVDPEFTIEPEALEFGDVQKGETQAKTLLLRQVGDREVEIQRIHVNPPYPEGLEFEYGPLPPQEWEDPAVPEQYVTARLHPTIAAGELDILFRIMTNIERLRTGHAVPLRARIYTESEIE